MKAKRISALILIAAMVLGVTACGGSKKETAEEPAQEIAVEEEKEEVTEEETKEEEAAEEPAEETEEETEEAAQKELKNGFNEETNSTITLGSFEFQIPNYAILNEDKKTDTTYMYVLETDSNNEETAVLLVGTGTIDSISSKEDFDSNYEALLDASLKQFNFTEFQRNENTFSANTNGYIMDGKTEVLFNEADNTFAVIIMMQGENAVYDYSADYDKIVDSVVYKETQEGESSDDLDPEFKEMMDSYEAFFDEYIAFMEKYKENPTDMSLLSELSDMLTKEAEMLKEMEGLDQSEMSSAELAYYLEVTGRIYEKLAKVTQF